VISGGWLTSGFVTPDNSPSASPLPQPFYSDQMAIADIIDFRKVGAKVHGMLITDVLDQTPLISAIVIAEEQRKHFLDKPAAIEGTVIGRNLTGASIQLENAHTGVEVKVKGVPENNRLKFTVTGCERIKVTLKTLVAGCLGQFGGLYSSPIFFIL
jgi:hypothetical protein